MLCYNNQHFFYICLYQSDYFHLTGTMCNTFIVPDILWLKPYICRAEASSDVKVTRVKDKDLVTPVGQTLHLSH